MQIILQSTGHAKSLAKSLCRALAGDRALKLTAAQDVVARMFGYADHRALCAAAGKGDPDPYEDEVTPEEARTRRETFAARLADALDLPLPKARALVEAIGPLKRSWQAPDDWRTTRQAYFAYKPMAGLIDWADYELWEPSDYVIPRIPPHLWMVEKLPKVAADPEVYGPKAYTVDVAFGREVEPKWSYRPVELAAKAAWGIEYVYAKIAMGDRVLGWLKGVVVDLSEAESREDLRSVSGLLDGPWIDDADALFDRRLAMEISDFGNLFERLFVVTAFVRDARRTPSGAGRALFAEAAEAVVARYEGSFHVVLNATPPQYDRPAMLQSAGVAGERLIRSTGRAAAARSLREYLLALPFPEAMKDVAAYDLGLPYLCAVPYGSSYARPIDAPADVFDVHDEISTSETRRLARALFGPAADATTTPFLADERSIIDGFDFDEVMAMDRVVRPSPLLWELMPKALVRIEIRRAPEHRNWTRIARAMIDPEAMMQYRPPLPRLPVEADTVTFVFANGTEAAVPERQFASGDFRDVIGPAFATSSGDPLPYNPYTDEMSIGDLWEMLTANVVLIYSGGEPVPFKDDRIVLTSPGPGKTLPPEYVRKPGWLTKDELTAYLARERAENGISADGKWVPGAPGASHADWTSYVGSDGGQANPAADPKVKPTT